MVTGSTYKYNAALLDDFDADFSFQKYLEETFRRNFDEVLYQAKKQYLGRDLTEEDEKLFSVHHGDQTRIFCDGKSIGFIKTEAKSSPEKGTQIVIEFTPTAVNLLNPVKA